MSIEHCIKTFIDKQIRGFNSTSINDLLKEIKALQQALTIALKPLKLEIIQEKFGPKISTPLQFYFYIFYRNDSEIAHGSFYGAMYSFGLAEPRKRPSNKKKALKEIEERQRSPISLLYLLTSLSISSLLSVISKEIPIDSMDDKLKEMDDEAWI